MMILTWKGICLHHSPSIGCGYYWLYGLVVGGNSQNVYHQKHVDGVSTHLKAIISKHNVPGLCLQGPMGAGKSVLTYLHRVTPMIAKFHLEWLYNHIYLLIYMAHKGDAGLATIWIMYY
jgi:hypothetical protein